MLKHLVSIYFHLRKSEFFGIFWNETADGQRPEIGIKRRQLDNCCGAILCGCFTGRVIEQLSY